MTNKTIFGAALLLVVGCGTLHAQSKVEDRTRDYALVLKEELKLSEEQYQKFLILQEKRMERFRKGMRHRGKMHKGRDRKGKMDAHSPKLHEMKESLGLTDKQAAELKTLHEKQMAFRQKMRDEMRDEQQSYRSALKSILSEEQLQKLKEKRKTLRGKPQKKRNSKG